MSIRKSPSNWQSSAVLTLIIAIVIISIGTYDRWWSLRILVVEAFYLGHLLGIIGASWVAVFTPIYVYLKQKSPQYSKTLINIHIIGNLIAFLLFSMHFWQQIGRPAEFAPEYGTGLSLYIILSTMVVTGLMTRFHIGWRFLKTWRTTHIGLTASFYIVLIIHIMRNVGVL